MNDLKQEIICRNAAGQTIFDFLIKCYQNVSELCIVLETIFSCRLIQIWWAAGCLHHQDSACGFGSNKTVLMFMAVKKYQPV